MYNYISQTQTTKRGFTLVETLVAITVLLLVVIGPLSIAQKGIQNAYFADEQVTAAFLAQEAIEAVRELRDREALDSFEDTGTSNTWEWIPSDCNATDETCAFDATQNPPLVTCASYSAGCVVKVLDGNYTHGAGDPPTSPEFTRTVTIDADQHALEGGVPVTVDVTWSAKVFGGAPHTLRLQTWIYDHYQRYEND